LEYEEDFILEKDLLQFSALGYQTLEINAGTLYKFLLNTNKIYLKPEPIDLSEVVINAVPQVEKEIGGLTASKGTIGYWRGEIAFGGEIATRLKIKNENTRLKELKVNVLENSSDSLKVRINIYDFDKNNPNVNLLNSNIFHTISRKNGIETIDLKPYNIKVSNDIIVSLELIEVFGDRIGFVVGGLNRGGYTYRRYISQDTWKLTRGVEMNFSLLTSYPKGALDKAQNRPAPSNITMLWDNSASMGDNERRINRELEFIEAYIEKIQNVDIELIQFNTRVNSKQTINVVDGDSEELLNILKAINYDGGTDYSCITNLEETKTDAIILVTDGNSTLSDFNFDTSTPVFVINSKSKANIESLQDLAYYSNGSFINLKSNSVEASLALITKLIEDFEIYTSPITENNLYGKVFDSIGPIEGASVRIKNSFIESISQKDGSYSIPAEFEDRLIVTSIGMKSKEIVVPHEKQLDINLSVDGILLDEIVVKQNSRTKETTNEYTRGSKISQKTIRPNDQYMSDLMQRQPGVKVTGPRESASYSLIRSLKGESPIFFLNGGLVSDIDVIDPQTVEYVVVLRSLAETNIYGSQGAAGVIKIKTKNANWTKVQNTALVKGNDYNEELPFINLTKTTTDIKDILSSKSYEEAYQLYLSKKKSETNLGVAFFIEVSDYFMKWDKEMAYTIVSNISDISYNDAKALKVLAYKLEDIGKLEQALFIYERILELRPNQAQSYRDAALMYQNTGRYEEAMSLYKQILSNSIEGVDFSGIQKTIMNEIRQLIIFHKSKVDFKGLPQVLLRLGFKRDFRVVFEWTNSNFDFEIQFVDPEKKYFIWKHTVLANNDRLANEIKTGFAMEEFFIDDSQIGDWTINIRAFSKDELFNPTFLKYTIYKDYGLPSQTKTIKVIKLYDQEEKVTVDKFRKAIKK
jgi:tetratricopeptide (TPR) repeat protein